MKRGLQDAQEAGFLERISQSLDELRPAERRLGEFLLDFPGELASYDGQELARLSGVSKATVSRFVRRIGFDSYEQARRAVRDEGRTGSRLFLGHAEPDPEESALALAVQEERENLAWTFERIGEDQLDALADAILAARKVWIVGQRISHSFATYLYWQLVKVVRDATVIPRDGESLGEHIAAIGPDDLAIVFALRRRMGGTDALLAEIGRTGARSALISDEGMAQDAARDWHFRCRIATATPQFNHAAVLTLCHQIVVRATLRAGPAGRERLRRVDELNERLGEY